MREWLKLKYGKFQLSTSHQILVALTVTSILKFVFRDICIKVKEAWKAPVVVSASLHLCT